jgi:hypothetical protein
LAFNDNSIVAKPDGTPVRGIMHGTTIYAIGPEQIKRGGTWSGRFRATAVSADVPVEITLVRKEVKSISGRTFQVARLDVEGYATREPLGGVATAAIGAPFKGEILVDVNTGLILELKVASRHPSYAVRREMIRVAGT